MATPLAGRDKEGRAGRLALGLGVGVVGKTAVHSEVCLHRHEQR